VQAAEAKYGPEHVVNMDETSWKCVQLKGRAIAPKAIKSVDVAPHGNVKGSTSAVCTISKAGDKYPPLYILKGCQDRLRRSLEPDVPEERVTLSKNGWLDEQIMLNYLSWVRVAVGEAPMALVIDAYTAHHTPRVQHKAERLAIEIIPVPRGLTGEYQPLDRSCFGPLKKISERLWDEKTHAHPEIVWKHKEGAKLLEEAWGHLTRETVQKGWQFQEDHDVDQIPEPGRESDDSEEEIDEEIDEHEYRPEAEEDEDEPASTGTWDARFHRNELARERAAQNGIADIVRVCASIHSQPCEHPAWHDVERREKSHQNEFWEAPPNGSKGKDVDGDLASGFLFP
jgi:hypothetical protein